MATQGKAIKLKFEDRRVTKMVGVKVTPLEYDEIEIESKRLGVSKSKFMRYIYKEYMESKEL